MKNSCVNTHWYLIKLYKLFKMLSENGVNINILKIVYAVTDWFYILLHIQFFFIIILLVIVNLLICYIVK